MIYTYRLYATPDDLVCVFRAHSLEEAQRTLCHLNPQRDLWCVIWEVSQ